MRGAGKQMFSTNIADLRGIYHFEIMAVFEPRISGFKALHVINKLGFSNSFVVDAEGFSRGIWLIWNENKVKLHVVASSRHSVIALIDDHSTLWILTGGSVVDKIHNITGILRSWNKEKFGNIFHNKRRLLARIQWIQDCLSERPSYYLSSLEETLLKDYKGYVSSDLNHTLISLIPKVPNPTNMTHFRPISLCITTYKVISKTLVQRLRVLHLDLVSPNQVAFMLGRQIQDNIVAAQEVLHKFKNARGKMGYIAWKIDLGKAYDKLQWGFIKQVLEEVGIEGKLNNLIMSYILNARYKVALNGKMSNSFLPKCRIKQCDPLSPYIFVLCMEKLFHIIKQNLLERAWKPVKISRIGPEISHVFFGEYLILFGQASVQQAETMRDCLYTFCDLLGQQVSFFKSRIHCYNNVSYNNAKGLAAVCRSHISKNPGNYLGIPLIHGRITKDTY
ncbi:hypothetical protein Dsin_016153 [Dipteronia sinensis]|uniref:Reverse transcriptase domain-containing protein n=1 Tax=Dipteronia sinensis TaxID=43782 RepID=A0AAE0E5G1_9ROSI|nr:hypothetical protein Dsin_016153 [Dipteronia sinensis]